MNCGVCVGGNKANSYLVAKLGFKGEKEMESEVTERQYCEQ